MTELHAEAFRILFDAIDEGLAICAMIVDADGQPSDYRFLATNPLFEAMTGLSGAVGHTAKELVPGLEEHWVERYARVGIGGERLRFQEGSQAMGRWFDVFSMPLGAPGQFAIVFKDDTARHQAELELRQYGQAFEALTNQLPQIVWVHGPDGEQQFVNDTFIRFFGTTREETRGDRWQLLIHPDDEASHVADFTEAVADHRPFHREVRVRAGTSGWRWLESWAEPRFDAVGRFVGHIGTSVDITERKEAEARVATALAGEARARRRAELLAEVLSSLGGASTVDGQLNALADILVPRVADFVTIEAPAERDHLLVVRHSDVDKSEILRSLRARHRLGPKRARSMWKVASGSAQLVTNAGPADEGLGPTTLELLERLGVRSHLAVPVDLGAAIQGSLMCGLTDDRRDLYTDDDLAFVTEIGQRAGLIIAATRARERERTSSLRLQKALLPERLQVHPEIDLAARYEAASDQLEVGGDWYDTFIWPSGEYGIVVGDVVGHGLEAAAAMGRLRSGAGILFMGGPPEPSAMLEALDRCAAGPDGVGFATAFCVVFDPKHQRLHYASAGHPPALLLNGEASSVWLDQATSPSIGALRAPDRHSAAVDLQPDDVLLCYSDGLIERRGETIDVGLERLAAVAKTLADSEVDALGRELVSALAERSIDDDTVVVVARYASLAPRFATVIPAQSIQLASLRTDLRTWLNEHDIDPAMASDVILAVGEACANAIEHAYQDRTNGEVSIILNRREEYLSVRIEDRGTWRPPSTAPSDRGRGIAIMSTVSSAYFRDSSATGTTVSLRFGLTAD